MQVFIWLDKAHASIAYFEHASLRDCEDVYYYPNPPEPSVFPAWGLVHAQAIVDAVNTTVFHVEELEQRTMDVWIVNPAKYKTGVGGALRHVIAGAILAHLQPALGRCGFDYADERGDLSWGVYRRRVFEALRESELADMDLGAISYGLVECIGLGLHHLRRFKAHASPIGMA